MIWNDIANHRYGPVFLNPVKVEDAPDYYDIIKKPMDLNSIKQRVKDGVSVVLIKSKKKKKKIKKEENVFLKKSKKKKKR